MCEIFQGNACSGYLPLQRDEKSFGLILLLQRNSNLAHFLVTVLCKQIYKQSSELSFYYALRHPDSLLLIRNDSLQVAKMYADSHTETAEKCVFTKCELVAILSAKLRSSDLM